MHGEREWQISKVKDIQVFDYELTKSRRILEQDLENVFVEVF